MENPSELKQNVYAVLKRYKQILSTGTLSPQQALDMAIDEIDNDVNSCDDNEKEHKARDFLYGVGTGITASLLYDLGKLIIQTSEDIPGRISMAGKPPGTEPK